MSTLDTLLERHPLATMRPYAWLVMLFLATAIVWAGGTRLEEVSRASGEVVPQGQVKVIQHLEGGIIQAIFVTEGQNVRRGDPLVRLTLATGGMNREELQVRIDGLVLQRARLEAEARGSKLKFPPEAAARRPDMVKREEEAYRARKRQFESVLSVLREKIRQRELDIQELETKRRAVSTDLGLARERFKMSEDLLKQGLTSRMEHVQLTREVESLMGQVESLDSAIPRARAALSEAKERVQEEQTKLLSDVNDDLRQVEVTIARTRELLAEATEQARRTEIVSPIDGVVKNMRYHTIGGVVKPGEAIMEIVPSEERLVVEARLNPIDRGYVHEGQSALVKISSYDFVRYGGLDGKVVRIAPDATTDADGRPYFRVVIETEKSYLGKTEGSLPITPGMQATVNIRTGDKSVMEYLIRPVLKLRYEAFRER